MATPSAALYGRVQIGGGSLVLAAQLGGGKPARFSGATDTPISFTQLIGEVLGKFYLDLPPDFPEVTFHTVRAEIAPGASAKFDATSTISWPKPFTILEGLSLTNLHLAFSSGGPAATQIAFTCGVQYGNLTDVHGFIWFSEGMLMVAGITFSRSLAIEDFLSWSTPGTNWGELLHVSLGPQSISAPVRLYYAKRPFETFRAGFNIDQARIEILDFVANISLSVSSGVAIAGSVQAPIDFGFIQFSGPTFGATSPEVDIKCGGAERWFRLLSGITFLSQPFGVFSVRVERAPGQMYYQFAGDIRYEGRIGPFTEPAFAFTWSKQQGFRVAEWPMPDFPGNEFLDYAKILNQLSGSGCAAFVKQMFRSVVTTRFNFSASLDSSGAGSAAVGSSLNVTVKGTFTVSASDTSDFLTVPLPFDLHVSLTKPAEFTFNALAGAIGQAIEDAGLDLLKQIVDDPQRSAAFFTVVIAEAALPQIIGMLVCRGWMAPIPPVPPAPPPIPPIPLIPPFLPPPPPGPSGSPGSTTLKKVRYEDSYLVIAWSAAPNAESYFVVVRNAWDTLATASLPDLSTEIAFADHWPSTTYAVNVQGVNKEGRGEWSDVVEIIRLAPLAPPSFTHVEQQLVLAWQRSSAPPPYSDAGSYDYSIYDPTGEMMASGSVPPSMLTLHTPLPPTAVEGVYRAVVRASMPGGSSISGQWSVAATLLVDPSSSHGWLVSVHNDLSLVSGENRTLTSAIVDPAIPEWIQVPVNTTVQLSPVPIRKFEIWRSFIATQICRTVQGFSVQMPEAGTSVTLEWSAIISGALPPDFTSMTRRGILGNERNLLWADLMTPVVMTKALSQYANASTDIAKLLVYAYETISQLTICLALSSSRYGLEDLVLALLTVREHYQWTPTPVTPASVASALVGSWPGPGSTAPLDVAVAMLSAFRQHGTPLNADQLAGALVAAFPLGPVTSLALAPYVLALSALFMLNDSASGLAHAIPDLPASPLAGALRQVFLAHTDNVEQYAHALHAQGQTAQAATPLLIATYPLTAAEQLAQTLIDEFPETTSSVMLTSWCLSIAEIQEPRTAQALVVVEPALSANTLAEALKTTYPTLSVIEEIAVLQASGTYASDAAPALARQFPDLTSTQLGWLLVTQFASTAPDPLSVTQALAGAPVDIRGAALALHHLYPLLTAIAIATILKKVYVQGEC